jgi:20S proteasome alpha/beta subunit
MANLHPKPQYAHKPTLERLPERKAVTIVAGFRCDQGVVICADTQETIDKSKMHVPKLRLEPKDRDCKDSPDDLMIAFAGAGEGPFVDKLVDRAWEDAQLSGGFDEVCDEIEKSIKKTYKEYGGIFQGGYCPYVELIYGVKMGGKSKLFKADGPVVNEKLEHAASGSGLYLAHFISTRMYGQYLTVQQAVILAAYVLFQAIRHVDGCGGDSHIAVLRNDGESQLLGNAMLNGISSHLRYIDAEVERIMLSAVDLETLDHDYEQRMHRFVEFMETARLKHREEVKGWKELKELTKALWPDAKGWKTSQ